MFVGVCVPFQIDQALRVYFLAPSIKMDVFQVLMKCIAMILPVGFVFVPLRCTLLAIVGGRCRRYRRIY